jgi:hypothetical protein
MEVRTLPRGSKSYAAEDAVELLADSLLEDPVLADLALALLLVVSLLFVSLLVVSLLSVLPSLLAALPFALPLRL